MRMRREDLGEVDKESGLRLSLVGEFLRVDLRVEIATRGQNEQSINTSLGLERVPVPVAGVFAPSRVRATEKWNRHRREEKRPLRHVLALDVPELVAEYE